MATASADGAPPNSPPPRPRSNAGITGRSESRCAGPAQQVTLASVRMCRSSALPESGGMGTTATPVNTQAVTAMTVSSVGSAHTATGPPSGRDPASAHAASNNCARDMLFAPIVTAATESTAPQPAGSSDVRSIGG